jgi:hypothetical protein
MPKDSAEGSRPLGARPGLLKREVGCLWDADLDDFGSGRRRR